MIPPDLSIVIVSWNVRDLMVECLESIDSTRGDLKVEVIVIDNASTDGSVEAVEARFPAAKIIKNRDNAGFAGASNQGIHESTGRHVLLLNPDTVVREHALERLVAFADGNPGIGLVGPRLIGQDGKLQHVAARSLPTVANWLVENSIVGRKLQRNRAEGLRNTSRFVEGISGAAMLIPRPTLEAIGVLDQTHPMYLEDIDYCDRVRASGRRTYYLSDAEIMHFGGESSSQVSTKARLMSLHAYELYFRARRGWLTTLAFRATVLVAAVWRAAVTATMMIAFPMIARANSKQLSLRREFISGMWAIGIVRTPRIAELSVDGSCAGRKQ